MRLDIEKLTKHLEQLDKDIERHLAVLDKDIETLTVQRRFLKRLLVGDALLHLDQRQIARHKTHIMNIFEAGPRPRGHHRASIERLVNGFL